MRNGDLPRKAYLDPALVKYYMNYYDSNVFTIRYVDSKDSFRQTSIPYLVYGYSDTVIHVSNSIKLPWLRDKLNYAHTNFKLKSNETISLYSPQGGLIDSKKL